MRGNHVPFACKIGLIPLEKEITTVIMTHSLYFT